MESDIQALNEAESEGLRYRGKESEPGVSGERGRVVTQGSAGTESVEDEDSGDNDSVVTVKNKADPEHADIFPESHPSLRDLSKCVRAFVGMIINFSYFLKTVI